MKGYLKFESWMYGLYRRAVPGLHITQVDQDSPNWQPSKKEGYLTQFPNSSATFQKHILHFPAWQVAHPLVEHFSSGCDTTRVASSDTSKTIFIYIILKLNYFYKQNQDFFYLEEEQIPIANIGAHFRMKQQLKPARYAFLKEWPNYIFLSLNSLKFLMQPSIMYLLTVSAAYIGTSIIPTIRRAVDKVKA